MSMRRIVLLLAVATVLGLAAPRAHAQIVGGGGYVGFGTPGFGGVVNFGTPIVGAPVMAAPVVPYVAPYPMVVPRPIYGYGYGAPLYRGGWGYGPRYYGPGYYRRRGWR